MIVKCPECKKMIHKIGSCPYCGNSLGFENANEIIEIHSNVAKEYSELSLLLASGKFTELIEKCGIVLKWMPKCSSVFWMRLLAKNGCKTDAELIEKGLNCNDSADFYNAVRYGSQTEKNVYESVKTLIEEIKLSLETEVVNHEYEEKEATSILKYQNEFNMQIQHAHKELFDLWAQLELIEQEMYGIEEDLKFLSNEHLITLEKSKNAVNEIKAETCELNECTAKKLNEYLVDLGNYLSLSDSNKKDLEFIRKNHPWIEKFNKKAQEREKISKKISSKLSELKSYKNQVLSVVSKFEYVEKQHRMVARDLSNYDFGSTYSLLGEKRYKAVLNNAGLKSIINNVD